MKVSDSKVSLDASGSGLYSINGSSMTTEQNQFREINFNSLMSFHNEALPFDIHIHLGGNRVTQIFRKGQNIDVMRLVNYKKKGASNFLFPRSQSKDYLKGAAAILHKKTMRAELNSAALHSLMMDMTKHLFGEIRENNTLEPHVFKVIEGLVNSYIVMVHFDFPAVLKLITMAQGRSSFVAHAVSTSFFSVLLGHEMNLNPLLLKSLGQGGLLHDIGLLEMPADFNEASNQLTLKEKVELHCHSAKGVSLIKEGTPVPDRVIKIINEHHEYWDGSGFAQSLKGEKIHPLARMVTIADHFCHHMQGSRSGIQALEPVLSFMKSQSIFDPKFLAIFCETLKFQHRR